MNLCKVKMGIREPSPTLIQPEYFLLCFLSIKTWYPEDSDKFGLGHPSHWNTELRCWNLWDQMSFCRWFFGGMKSYPVLFRDYFVKETRINGTWTNLDFNGSMSMSFVSCVFQKLLPSLRTNSECPWRLNLLPQKESSFHFLTKISRGKQCCSFWGVYTLSYTNIAMENGPGMKMYFLLKMRICQRAMLVLPAKKHGMIFFLKDAESLLGDHRLRWYLNHAGWIGSLSSSAHDHLRLLRQASGGPSAIVDVDLPHRWLGGDDFFQTIPWKTNMSLENQWLEDVFPIETSPFWMHMLVFGGVVSTTFSVCVGMGDGLTFRFQEKLNLEGCFGSYCLVHFHEHTLVLVWNH